jgi:hypothetical protein
MKTTILAASLLALAASPVVIATPASAAGCGGASYGSSAPIGSTHYGVNNINAKGVACGIAKKVALASEGVSGETYTSKGFRCVPRALQGSGARPYVCTKIKKPAQGPRAKVTFVTLGAG